MAQTMVNFRMDEELKKNMEAVCADMGLSVTAAFTIFAKTVARERRIPFDVTADPWSETAKAMEDVERGRNLSGPYRSREALREALDA